jgi:hypothetical protein
MKMIWVKRFIKLLIIVLVLFILYVMINNLFGWYGYKKWEYRVATTSIEESKERGVFLKELQYKIITDDKTFNKKLAFYIERGFRFGKHSSEVTRPIELSEEKPYQLRYYVKDNDYTGEYNDNVYGMEIEGEKWAVTWVDFWMDKPYLTDTMIFILLKRGEDKGQFVVPMDSIGYVKVW